MIRRLFSRNSEKPQAEDLKKSVVVVEDDPDTAELVRLHLEAAGLRVSIASDGLSGMEMIRDQRPDAVVLDIKVPKMNGYEICAAMQGDAQLRAVPIMIVTGLVDDIPGEEESWRQKMSVAGFMCKPFDPARFTRRVVEIIENASAPAPRAGEAE